VAVVGGSGHAEGFRDLGGALAAGSPGAAGGDLVGVHHGGPPADAALPAGGVQPGEGPLVDQVAFEFGERGHDGEEELALPGGV